MPLKQRTVNLINLKRRGIRTSMRLQAQLRLYPSANAVAAIGAVDGSERNGIRNQFADVAGTLPGVGIVTTTLESGPSVTRLSVPLSALRDALSSIGLSLPEGVNSGGVLQVLISGSTAQNPTTGEISLILSSGIAQIAELSSSSESPTERKPASRSSSTSPRQQTSPMTITR